MGETAYCCRCKSKQTIKDPKNGTTSNGRACCKGVCAKCGTKMMKFIKKV